MVTRRSASKIKSRRKMHGEITRFVLLEFKLENFNESAAWEIVSDRPPLLYVNKFISRGKSFVEKSIERGNPLARNIYKNYRRYANFLHDGCSNVKRFKEKIIYEKKRRKEKKN